MMLQKIAKMITNNFGLKCLAAVLAVVFWLVIVNLEDPEKTKTFTVQVEIENADYLTNMGKTYEVLNNSDTIFFTATAKRSVIERMSASDFKVTANMEDIVNMSEIPITITAQKYANQISISKKTQFVELNVENLVTKEFNIEIQTSGELPDGYSFSSLSVSPGKVSVTGPESVVGQIDKAAADVDISSMHEDFVQEANVILYDEKGDEIPQDRLTLNHQTATVSAGVLQQKTVPVEYETTGTPASGYRVGSVTGSITELTIRGKEKDVENVESVLISGSALNVGGRQQSLELTVNLSDYLPDGVSLAENEELTSTVTIEIESVTKKTFEIPAANIELKNVPDGYSAVLEETTIPVVLTGYPSDLDQISASNIRGSVDLSGLTAGSHSLEVSISGDYLSAEEIRVTVTLEESSLVGNISNLGGNNDADEQ